MCTAKDWLESPPSPSNGQRSSRKPKVRVHCLIIRRRFDDMELRNLKLYLENTSILEENERLRQMAIRLRQENQVLLSEFQKKFKSSKMIKSN